MNELIKYFEALEARIQAQEARIAALEQQEREKKQLLDQLCHQLADTTAAAAAMSEQLKQIDATIVDMMQHPADPEVEVELVYPEEEEAAADMPEAVEEQAPEAPAEPAPVEVIPAPEPEEQAVQEPAPEPVAEPEPEPAPIAEPVVEAPVPEPEPAKEAPKPRVPQQTSLFGAAVTDIRQAVSIGDRFLFQRELFGGNGEKLQQALSELNVLHSFDEAVNAIEKFGWDKQSPTYELFINVLHRRFG